MDYLDSDVDLDLDLDVDQSLSLIPTSTTDTPERRAFLYSVRTGVVPVYFYAQVQVLWGK